MQCHLRIEKKNQRTQWEHERRSQWNLRNWFRNGLHIEIGGGISSGQRVALASCHKHLSYNWLWRWHLSSSVDAHSIEICYPKIYTIIVIVFSPVIHHSMQRMLNTNLSFFRCCFFHSANQMSERPETRWPSRLLILFICAKSIEWGADDFL